MKYISKGKKIIMTEYDSFDIGAILECGQCFRFEKIAEGSYRIIAHGKLLNIVSENGNIEFFPTDTDEFERLWLDYFDLKRDYLKIKERLSAVDGVMKSAVDFSPGIRHLRQDTFECLISFIISQNNRIPMIMRCVSLIAHKYGSVINGVCAFPSPAQLAKADVSGLMECKAGFRAKYIIDAVEKVNSGDIDLNSRTALTTPQLREALKKIKGVGDKVADCVMLFSYGRSGVFPTDVWILRAMSELYFNGAKTSADDIRAYAYKYFGQDAGMANQYIFHYARSNQHKINRK